MSTTADVTGGKPIAVWSQSISGVNAINLLVVFYDIQGRKREVLFFILSWTPHDTIISIFILKIVFLPKSFNVDDPYLIFDKYFLEPQ
jgi:hypothetical protein